MLSAIVPTKNRPLDLEKLIESIVTQQKVPEEIIIVDQSDHINQKYVEYNTTSLNIIYIWDITITGLVHAKKKGVEKSKGDIVCFLEDDVILDENYFYEVEKYFDDFPANNGCCGIVKNVPNKNKFRYILFMIFHRGIFYDRRSYINQYPEKFKQKIIHSSYLSGGISSFRRKVFNAVSFDTENKLFMLEDIDFSTRASKVFGIQSFCINTNVILEHNMSPANRAFLEQKYRKKTFEYSVFYKKNKTVKFSTINYAWLLIGLFIEMFYESILNRNIKIILHGIDGFNKGLAWKIIEPA